MLDTLNAVEDIVRYIEISEVDQSAEAFYLLDSVVRQVDGYQIGQLFKSLYLVERILMQIPCKFNHC